MPILFFDPGQMTARLDLETPQETPDGQGGVTLGWTGTASLWARIEPVSTMLSEEAAAEAGRITHRIWVRFRSDVSAGQRLRKGARIFRVKLVQDPDETGRYLVCQCEEDAR
jgi:SPP1 family predicted phage head-tail adaptor